VQDQVGALLPLETLAAMVVAVELMVVLHPQTLLVLVVFMEVLVLVATEMRQFALFGLETQDLFPQRVREIYK